MLFLQYMLLKENVRQHMKLNTAHTCFKAVKFYLTHYSETLLIAFGTHFSYCDVIHLMHQTL